MKNQIQKELGQEIKIEKIIDNELVFFMAEDSRRYCSKLTKTGKHKKNSVRLFN